MFGLNSDWAGGVNEKLDVCGGGVFFNPDQNGRSS